MPGTEPRGISWREVLRGAGAGATGGAAAGAITGALLLGRLLRWDVAPIAFIEWAVGGALLGAALGSVPGAAGGIALAHRLDVVDDRRIKLATAIVGALLQAIGMGTLVQFHGETDLVTPMLAITHGAFPGTLAGLIAGKMLIRAVRP